MARLVSGLLLALVLSGEAALAQGADPGPAQVRSDDGVRFTVDTAVAAVAIDDDVTVATMAPSAQSPCPSDQYIFERVRPKWLNTTGRLLQAQKEGAVLRISFSCVRGYQSINAIQFLSPPPGQVATSMPRRDEAVPEPAGGRAALDPRRAPLPQANAPADGVAVDPQRTGRLSGAPRAGGAAPPPAAGAPGSTPPAAANGGPPVPTGSTAQGADGQPSVSEPVRAIPLP